MKYFAAAILTLIFLSGAILAQSFTVDIDRTEISDTLGSEIVFDFKVKNTSDSELTLSFVRSKNLLPEGWTSSLCFNFCFAPHLDTIVTTPQFGSSPIPQMDSTNFSVHVFPQEIDGLGEVGIRITNYDNTLEYLDFLLTANTTTTNVKSNKIDNGFELGQNYPNPFNPSTRIQYSIPTVETLHATSLQSFYVELTIYDILGREIATLVNQRQRPGNYEVTFNGANYPSGVYFYSLTSEGYSETKKMIIGK